MNRILSFSALCILCFVLSVSQAHAFSLWPFGKKSLDYDVTVIGIDGKERTKALEKTAEEAVTKDNPPQTADELEAYAGMMGQRVQAALHADGLYEAAVTQTVNLNDDTPVVEITVVPGRIYTVSAAELYRNGSPSDTEEKAFETHRLADGAPAVAEDILTSAVKIEQAIVKDRCFLSLSVTPALIPDHDAATVTVRYRVDAGPEADFGAVTIAGERTTKDDVIGRFLTWKEGECYAQEKVRTSESALLKSRLFSVARITPAETPDADGRAAMHIELKERAHRTVTAGTQFATDTGIGVSAGWEHRNVKGLAHGVTTKLEVSELEIAASAGYTIPFFRGPHQVLRFTTELAKEDTDSYESTSISGLAAVERKISSKTSAGYGLGARFSEIRQDNDTEGFFLLYAPVFIARDSRDDTLDPRKGVAARLTVTPYADLSGVGKGFVKTQGEVKTYLTASNVPFEPTLAMRGALGLISGASVGDVPADTRFTTGGGGTVRGYTFQGIGPRTSAGEPSGGVNLTEAGAELRLRFNDTFGAALFAEGGGLTQESAPLQRLDMFWAVGGGVRYFSPLGPFRIDVGVPLREIDGKSSVQLYMSLGQAF